MMYSFLEVSDDNVEILNDRGIECKVGDQLGVVVAYDINLADPDVGINSDDVQITSARCKYIDVMDLMNDDKLHEKAMDEYENAMADMADMAEQSDKFHL